MQKLQTTVFQQLGLVHENHMRKCVPQLVLHNHWDSMPWAAVAASQMHAEKIGRHYQVDSTKAIHVLCRHTQSKGQIESYDTN